MNKNGEDLTKFEKMINQYWYHRNDMKWKNNQNESIVGRMIKVEDGNC